MLREDFQQLWIHCMLENLFRKTERMPGLFVFFLVQHNSFLWLLNSGCYLLSCATHSVCMCIFGWFDHFAEIHKKKKCLTTRTGLNRTFCVHLFCSYFMAFVYKCTNDDRRFLIFLLLLLLFGQKLLNKCICAANHLLFYALFRVLTSLFFFFVFHLNF